jgi:PAS domain-containing protein
MDISSIVDQKLIDNMPCGVIVYAPDTTVLYANVNALKILRLTRDQIEGKDVFDPRWHFIDEDGNKLSIDEFPVNRVISSEDSLNNFVMGVTDSSSKEITWVLIHAYIERHQDESINYIVIIFTDISKERNTIPYKDIVVHTSDSVIITEANSIDDPGPKIVYVNDAFSDKTGYTAEEIIGQSPRILQGEKTDKETLKRIRKALDAKLPCREMIFKL